MANVEARDWKGANSFKFSPISNLCYQNPEGATNGDGAMTPFPIKSPPYCS